MKIYIFKCLNNYDFTSHKNSIHYKLRNHEKVENIYFYLFVVIAGYTQNSTKTENKNTSENIEVFDGKKIVRSNEEWEKIFTPEQYRPEKGTETPHEFNKKIEKGTYYCVSCNLPLYSSVNKLNQVRMASFYKPIHLKI